MASHAPCWDFQKDLARSKFKRRAPSRVEVPFSFLLFFSRIYRITLEIMFRHLCDSHHLLGFLEFLAVLVDDWRDVLKVAL
jgi:hypothetical protein